MTLRDFENLALEPGNIIEITDNKGEKHRGIYRDQFNKWSQTFYFQCFVTGTATWDIRDLKMAKLLEAGTKKDTPPNGGVQVYGQIAGE